MRSASLKPGSNRAQLTRKEPGELYLLVILGQDGATRNAWMEEHFDRPEELRAQRLPEVKGFMVTTGARDSAGLPPTRIMQPVGISLLDPEEEEAARWALARIREQSAYTQLSERARELNQLKAHF